MNLKRSILFLAILGFCVVGPVAVEAQKAVETRGTGATAGPTSNVNPPSQVPPPSPSAVSRVAAAATPTVNGCYRYMPNYSNPTALLNNWLFLHDGSLVPAITPAATFTIPLSLGGGQTKTISVAHQNPPTILQDMWFVPIYASNSVNWDYYGPGISCFPFLFWVDTYMYGPGAYDVYREPAVSSFVTTSTVVPGTSWGLGVYNQDYWYAQYMYFTPINLFKVNAFKDIASSTPQARIIGEDAVINHISQSGVVVNRQANHTKLWGYPLTNNPGYKYVDTSAPATNCQKLSGTGSKKVIFMRGDGWTSSVSDFLWHATAARDQLLLTEPFATPANQFTFYADLKKQNQSAALAGTAATVKAQSSCNGIDSINQNAFEYVYLNSGSTKSYPGQGVTLVNSTDFTHATKGALSVVREIGRTIGNLTSEVPPPVGSTPILPANNCGFDPFTAFRDSATNHIFGAIDEQPCSRSPYYRPNSASLMGDSYSSATPTASANKFDVVSCGYIKAGLAGQALTKDNAKAFWPACKALDTAKNGIPPVIPVARTPDAVSIARTPDPLYVSPVVLPGGQDSELGIILGSEVVILGAGFTPTGNSVQFVDSHDPLRVYEVTNIPSQDVSGSSLVFRIPVTIPIPFDSYYIKVGALNSDWSDWSDLRYRVSFSLHGLAPTNLVGQATKRGKLDFSWSDNSTDELSFDLEAFVESTGRFRKVGTIFRNETSYTRSGLLPSVTNRYRIRAVFDDGTHSDYSNVVTVTSLPKPAPPVLSAVAGPNNTIVLSWTITDAGGIMGYRIDSMPSGDRVTGMIANPGSLMDSLTDGLSEEGEGRVATLQPNTMYCYVVIAEVNSVNESDDSNVACARTSLYGISFDIPTDPLTGNQTLALNIGSAGGGQISSVESFVDGTSVGTDNLAPWNVSLNTTQFTNGSHNLYSIIRYVSGPPITIPSQPIQISNPILAPVLNSFDHASAVPGSWIIARGSGFSTSVSSNTDRIQLSFGGASQELTAGISAGFNYIFEDVSMPTRAYGTYVAFRIPFATATGVYTVKAARQGGPWSNSLSFEVLPALNQYNARNPIYVIPNRRLPDGEGSFSLPNVSGTITPIIDVSSPLEGYTSGRLTTIQGRDFSPTGNKVQLTTPNLARPPSASGAASVRLAAVTSNTTASTLTWEITDIPSTNGTSITFSIPTGIPSAAYTLKAAASNSEWSEGVPVQISSRETADEGNWSTEGLYTSDIGTFKYLAWTTSRTETSLFFGNTNRHSVSASSTKVGYTVSGEDTVNYYATNFKFSSTTGATNFLSAYLADMDAVPEGGAYRITDANFRGIIWRSEANIIFLHANLNSPQGQDFLNQAFPIYSAYFPLPAQLPTTPTPSFFQTIVSNIIGAVASVISDVVDFISPPPVVVSVSTAESSSPRIAAPQDESTVTAPQIGPIHKSSLTDGVGGVSLNKPVKVFVSGNYAYVIGYGGTLEIMNISSSTNPIHEGSLAHGVGGAVLDTPTSLFVLGDYAYVTSQYDTLEIVDISDKTKPVHKGKITNGTGGAVLDYPSSVFVSGNYAYVTSSAGNAIEVVDVSSPATPVHKGKIVHGTGGALLNQPTSVFVQQNYAYIAVSGSNALEIIDVIDPANPVHVSSLVNGSNGAVLYGPNSIFVKGRYAYLSVVGSRAVEIVDITDPVNPVHKGKIVHGTGGSLLDSPTDIFVSGDYAYLSVAGTSDALEIVDVSDPANPVHKGSLSNTVGGALLNNPSSLAVSGDYVYVVSRTSNILEIIYFPRSASAPGGGSGAGSAYGQPIAQTFALSAAPSVHQVSFISSSAPSKTVSSQVSISRSTFSGEVSLRAESVDMQPGDYSVTFDRSAFFAGSSDPVTVTIVVNRSVSAGVKTIRIIGTGTGAVTVSTEVRFNVRRVILENY
ncbi:MAG: Ig-like domain-containing protein [bacterium]